MTKQAYDGQNPVVSDDQWLRDSMQNGLSNELPSPELISRTLAAMNEAKAQVEQTQAAQNQTEQAHAAQTQSTQAQSTQAQSENTAAASTAGFTVVRSADAAQKPELKVTPGTKNKRASAGGRFRKIVSVAVAACLCMTLVGGGVAYAGETGTVDVTVGHQTSTQTTTMQTTVQTSTGTATNDAIPQIRLKVNRFDRVIGAEGLNEVGKQLVEQNNVWGMSADEAMTALCGSNASNADVTVDVNCKDTEQCNRLNDSCEKAASKHGFGFKKKGQEAESGQGYGPADGTGNGQGNGPADGTGYGHEMHRR